ncbi:MAG: Arm DNA-binding domain-containing protein [Enhydrobacter sp.]
MLTDTRIRQIKPPKTRTKLADERGLFLLLTPQGGRRWRFKYRFAGKEKLLALGTYPDVSLSNAREARDLARKALASGVDPSAIRQQEKQEQAAATANDFESITREWLENVKGKWATVILAYSNIERRYAQLVWT